MLAVTFPMASSSEPAFYTQANPFCSEDDGLWYWYDETYDICPEGFETAAGAKDQLDDYCFWLDNGMTRYAAQMAHGV